MFKKLFQSILVILIFQVLWDNGMAYRDRQSPTMRISILNTIDLSIPGV